MNTYIKTISLVAILATLVLLSGCAGTEETSSIPNVAVTSGTPAPGIATPYAIYWPTNGWRASTPEQQGMDSAQLAAFFEVVKQNRANVYDAVIIRHGYIVAEAYYPPNTQDRQQIQFSCTKSVISILLGIAIDKGYVRGVDQTLLSQFPNRAIANNDDSKRAITLENILDMTSGLRWSESAPYGSPENNYSQERASPDWVQYVLDQPMVANPGKHYEYTTGGPHLLSAIIGQASGMPTIDFARKFLFEPLGISDMNWDIDRQGNVDGGNGLQLKPRDAAKIGYLYLHNGMWDGQQIVSTAWVRASTQRHVTPPGNSDGYGYLWWLFPDGAYSAIGYGGQYIMVVPGKDLVVVVNSMLSSDQLEQGLVPKAIQEHILPAVKANDPLPDNPQGMARLKAALP